MVRILYQGKTDPIIVPAAAIDGAVSVISAGVPKSIYSFQYQALAFTAFVSPTPSIGGWGSQLSIPQRALLGLRPAQQQFIAFTPLPVVATAGWDDSVEWPQPTRRTGLAAHHQQFLAFTPVTTTTAIDGAVSVMSAGVPKSIYSFQYQALSYTTFTPVTTATVDGWGSQLSIPQRKLLGLLPSQQQFLAFDPAVFTPSIGWFSQWTDITRRLIKTSSLAQYLALDPAVFVPSIDNQITLTQRRIRGLPAAEQQFLAYSPFVTPAATVNEDSWHKPWSEPIRANRVIPTSGQQDVPEPPNATVLGDWPDFAKGHSFLTALQASVATFVQVIVTTTPSIAGWGAPLFEVPKRKAGLTTANQQFLVYTEAAPFTETVTEDRWHQPWSEPVRTKRALPTSEQQAAAFVSVVVTAAPSIDGWGSPFAEVPKPKAGLTAAAQQALAFNPAVFVAAPDAWSNIWRDPPKPKVSITVAAQQALIAIPFNETTSEDKWHQAWSEPVRTKPGLAASRQQATAHSPFVAPATAPPADGWVNPFGVVPKAKAGLSTANQQFQALTEAAPFPEAVLESKWHQPWSEPIVKKKAGLPVGEHPFTAFTARPPIVSFAFYNNLSDPVRFRRFPAAEQVALARNTFVPTPIAGAMMDVTETGDVFNGTLRAFNVPVACYVSIIQNDPHLGGYASIIEN